MKYCKSFKLFSPYWFHFSIAIGNSNTTTIVTTTQVSCIKTTSTIITTILWILKTTRIIPHVIINYC